VRLGLSTDLLHQIHEALDEDGINLLGPDDAVAGLVDCLPLMIMGGEMIIRVGRSAQLFITYRLSTPAPDDHLSVDPLPIPGGQKEKADVQQVLLAHLPGCIVDEQVC
jgi:hypothetical protein